MMGDVFLQERQDTVIDSDNIVIIIVAAAAFIGQLIAVFIGMEQYTKCNMSNFKQGVSNFQTRSMYLTLGTS